MSIKYFVYEWTNLKNGKKYIGSHKGEIHDSYIGSGKHFIRAYNQDPENFRREILEYLDSYKEMQEYESQLLTSIDAANNSMYYNLTNASGGGYNHGHLSDEERNYIYKRWHDSAMNRLKNMTKEEKEELKKKKQTSWKSSPLREKHSIETSKRRQIEEMHKTDNDRKNFSDVCKSSYWSRSEEDIKIHHKSQSEGVSRWHKNMSIEDKQKRAAKVSETKKSQQLKYIHKFIEGVKIERFSSPDELESYINSGWILGRGPRIRK